MYRKIKVKSETNQRMKMWARDVLWRTEVMKKKNLISIVMTEKKVKGNEGKRA